MKRRLVDRFYAGAAKMDLRLQEIGLLALFASLKKANPINLPKSA
jgi:hypothetical protein